MAKLEVRQLVEAIAGSGADVVSIGGVAVILIGGEHYTKDVDFAFSRKRESLKKIVEALAPYHPKPVDWPEGVPFVWDDQTLQGMTTITLDTDIGRIDFLAEPDGAPPYDDLRSRAIPFDLEGVTIYVACIEDLIAMKRAAGRPKDLAHIAELETIQRLMREEADN
ncbi:MAG: hypothetical protein K1X67_01965 [Fimbriimonadaceae bacterium]|nr:hypothetical protein [Fimbriimonadaceae bacterium]